MKAFDFPNNRYFGRVQPSMRMRADALGALLPPSHPGQAREGLSPAQVGWSLPLAGRDGGWGREVEARRFFGRSQDLYSASPLPAGRGAGVRDRPFTERTHPSPGPAVRPLPHGRGNPAPDSPISPSGHTTPHPLPLPARGEAKEGADPANGPGSALRAVRDDAQGGGCCCDCQRA